MVIPDPEVGLVIHFNYLWKRESITGHDNARYARPCAIVVARTVASDGGTIVVVAPITHSPPLSAEDGALEIPIAVKRHLGLDDDRSWIVFSEVNEFKWPGYDLQPTAKGQIAYGILPPSLFTRLRQAMLSRLQSGSLDRVMR